MGEKTCGNCGHGCYESTVYCEVTNDDMLVSCEACDDWIESKKQHIRCDNITQLEQRYAQLAEVAREMLQFIKNIEREYPRLLDSNRKSGGQILYSMPSAEYAEQLEELGWSYE